MGRRGWLERARKLSRIHHQSNDDAVSFPVPWKPRVSKDPLVSVIVVLGLIAAVSFLLWRKRRSQFLRARFGPEYDRVVKKEGNIGRGEDVLQFLTKRREKLESVPLSPHRRSEFANRWTGVQSQFVDDPKRAVSQAVSDWQLRSTSRRHFR